MYHFRQLSLLVGLLACPLVATALSVDPVPADFAAVQQSLGEIESDLSGAQCGGWDFERSVSPHIPVVTGVPGRNGDPLGNIKSGMARRIETGGSDGTGFIYPDSTTGFMSACVPGQPEFFEWNTCQRPGGAGFEGPEIYPFPSRGCENTTEDCATSDPLGGGVTWTCDAICKDLNRRYRFFVWDQFCPEGIFAAPTKQTDCFDLDIETRPAPPPDNPNCTLVPRDWFYCCTGEPVTGGRPNCRPCTGSECRTPNAPEDPQDFVPGTYRSFFRRYLGSCTREPLTQAVPQDDFERLNLPVSCYSFYYEYDPKTSTGSFWDRRCTIANTYDDLDHDFVNMPTSQQSEIGVGQAAIDGNWPDPPSDDYKIIRNGDFRLTDSDEGAADLWYPNISGGFSLINGRELADKYNNDLSFALMAPDFTHFKAYPQLTTQQPLSSGALLRSFEDTVTNERAGRGTLAEWLYELSNELHKVLSSARVRLVLPTPKSVGLDPADPLLSPTIPDPQNPSEPRDPKTQRLEFMLQASEDMLGEVAAYLERLLLIRLKEEPIPVLVPLGHPTEYRGRAQDWCSWILERAKYLIEITISDTTARQAALAGLTNCEAVTPTPEITAAQNLMRALEIYAQRLDVVRLLRTELYQYQTAFLEHQTSIINTLGNWEKGVADAYQAFLDNQTELDRLKQLWEESAALLRTFHDTTNQPWCLNQRFTPAIFTFFEDGDWFPGWPNPTGGLDGPPEADNPDTLPRFIAAAAPADAVLDFSSIRSATGALAFPVLKPIEVSLDTLELNTNKYDPRSKNNLIIPVLPPLPEMPTIATDVRDFFQNGIELYTENEPPSIATFFPPPPTGPDEAFFERVKDIITGMDNAYKKFWDSLTLDPTAVTDGTEEDCPFHDAYNCVHNEMDLRERFARMCARPAVYLKEDFASTGPRPNPQAVDFDEGNTDPLRRDWVYQTLNQEKVYSGQGWGLKAPDERTQQEFINELRSNMFEQTLQRSNVNEADRLKYIVDPNAITPAFEVRPPLNLFPQPEL